jgi:hypothetical protein
VMAIAFLGSDRLWPLLDRRSVEIVNATSFEAQLSVVGIVIVLHGSDGSRSVRRSTKLALAVGDSAILEDDRPASDDVIAIEAILRVISTASCAIAEVYLRSDETRTAPIEAIELGVMMTEEAPAGATPIPEVEGVSAYMRIEP